MQPIIRDLKNDQEKKFEEIKDGYTFTVKVKYDNDAKLVKQKIFLDKDLNLTKVEVLDNKDNVKMRMTIEEYDLKANIDDDIFKIKEITEEENNKPKEENQEKNQSENNNQDEQNNTKTQSKIENIVYPMYLPVNTYLSSQDTIPTEAGERIIMTFSGDKPFLLVQETAEINNTTDFINGDPYLITDKIGAVTDYSVSWIDEKIEYNVVSDTMNIDELISVAQSISPKAIGK